MLKTFQLVTSKQNATNNKNSKNSNSQIKTTLPLVMTKSMVESAWAEDMGQFLYHLDPNTRKITRKLEKLQMKIINSVPSSLTKFAYIYIYIYIDSIYSLIQISLNIIDIFCLHIFLLILSYCRIDFIVFGGN